MKRRQFIRTGAATSALALVYPLTANAETSSKPETFQPPAFELEEMSITELQKHLQAGRYSSRSLVEKYVDRIKDIDKDGPNLNSVIELNPDAESIAANLDRERKERGVRGALHGIPILIKDNIDTADRMMTTAGSLALVGA